MTLSLAYRLNLQWSQAAGLALFAAGVLSTPALADAARVTPDVAPILAAGTASVAAEAAVGAVDSVVVTRRRSTS